jgi:hypothetical protein
MLYSLNLQVRNATWRSVHNNGQYSLDLGEYILFLDVTNIKIHVMNCPPRVCQWPTLVSSTNKTARHEITEILLKVALNTITLTPNRNIPDWYQAQLCNLVLSGQFITCIFIFVTSRNRIYSPRSSEYCPLLWTDRHVQYFSYFMPGSFIGGGNQSRSLTNSSTPTMYIWY